MTTTTTTTTATETRTSSSMTIALRVLDRLDIRLLTLICAVSCAAGAVGLNC